jgi:hypothetical protein
MPAPNSFDYTDFLSRETLRRVINKKVIADAFNTDYNKNFTQTFATGAVVRVPYPVQFLPGTANDLGYEPQPIIDRATDVRINQIVKCHFAYDVLQRALESRHFEEALETDIVLPSVDTICQDIEDRCAKYAYQHAGTVIGVLGTNPTTFDQVFGAARQRMVNLGAPSGQRKMILDTAIGRPLTAAELPLFAPLGEIERAFKEGAIGRAQTFDTYESASLYAHTSGAWAGVVECTTAPVPPADLGTGITTMAITHTSGDTFKVGDKTNWAAVNEVNNATRRSTGRLRDFTILSQTLLTATTSTITFSPPMFGPGSPYQNVDALPLAGADMALWPGTNASGAAAAAKTGKISLALPRDAFALVGVKLTLPPSGGDFKSSTKRDPNSGLAISFVQQFDARTMEWITRFDCPMGFGEFYSGAAIAVAGGV